MIVVLYRVCIKWYSFGKSFIRSFTVINLIGVFDHCICSIQYNIIQYNAIQYNMILLHRLQFFLCLILQTMSVADFGTTLAHLIRVCWSAAAGQLHLASIGDSESPSVPQQRGGHSPSPSPAMSDEGRINQLRAGICVAQEDNAVSSKVSIIIKEYSLIFVLA